MPGGLSQGQPPHRCPTIDAESVIDRRVEYSSFQWSLSGGRCPAHAEKLLYETGTAQPDGRRAQLHRPGLASPISVRGWGHPRQCLVL